MSKGDLPVHDQGDALLESHQGLLESFLAISSDLDLRSVLTRIVESASRLTDAAYGALGVLGDDGTLADFITVGIDDETAALIGEPPLGRGILGLLIDEPVPLRLPDLRRHPASAGMPAEHPEMSTFLGVPIRIRGTVFGNLYLTEKRSGEFTAQDETLVLALAQAASLVIDNARAYGLSERRRIWLEAAAELTEALQGPIPLDEALAEVVRRARVSAGAAAAAIVQFPDGTHPIIGASDVVEGFDVLAVVRAVIGDIRLANQDAVALEAQFEGGMAVVLPLGLHLSDRAVLLVAFDTAASSRATEQQDDLTWFADQASLAIDRAQAIEERAELALVTERARIARDLHDVVIQRLFATGLKLESFRTTGEQKDAELVLAGVVKDLDLTIRDIRASIFGLQHRDEGSLRSEIGEILNDYTEVLGFAPALRTYGPIDSAISPALAENLLAVLREGLSNVARHARAKDAAVEVAVSGTDVLLRVVDGGIGIPEHHAESGLRNVRERAELLGGTLSVTPNAGPGTTLVWQAPLGPAPDSDLSAP
ncbi:GAF domain-containing protein [Methylocystis sp.]|uniref:GAF domain-containing sensor histidine kinase n=1 Tax=Methylocystis sp. TaxID=1911079 RepID=UPI003DA59BD4